MNRRALFRGLLALPVAAVAGPTVAKAVAPALSRYPITLGLDFSTRPAWLPSGGTWWRDIGDRYEFMVFDGANDFPVFSVMRGPDAARGMQSVGSAWVRYCDWIYEHAADADARGGVAPGRGAGGGEGAGCISDFVEPQDHLTDQSAKIVPSGDRVCRLHGSDHGANLCRHVRNFVPSRTEL